MTTQDPWPAWTSQQVRGAIGTAPLSTPPRRARNLVADGGPAAQVLRQAAVEGYVTAFRRAASIRAVGALICGSRAALRRRPSD